jgi:hypothetical protein
MADFGGIIGGAMYGLGGALQSVGSDAFRAQLEQEKAARLAELSAKYRAADRQAEHELGVKRDESRYNLENRDRLAIKGELEKYSQPREETLPPDQAGPVGTITPSGSDIARQGGIIAGRMGRPDIANQYRQFGEPGKLDTMAKEDEYKQAGDERAGKRAIALKQAEGSPSEVRARGAQGRLAEAHADYYEGMPQREERIAKRDREANDSRAARELLNNSKALNKEALDLQKSFDAEFGGVPVSKLTEGQKRERAQRMIEIEDKRQSAKDAEKEGRALLGRGRGAAGGGAGLSEEDVFGRNPVRSDEPPIKGAYLNDKGFWYGPDDTPVITRSGRPVRKSLDEKNDTDMTDAVDRDASGVRVEASPAPAKTSRSGPVASAAGRGDGFNSAEQELIDEQATEAGKRRVRNEILRQRQEDSRRAAAAAAEKEAKAGLIDYARRGIDPREPAR